MRYDCGVKKETRKSAAKVLIGIDEVGRGPLAGPAVVGAFACDAKAVRALVARGQKHTGCKLKDSKALTQIQREKWNAWIHEQIAKGECNATLGWKSAKEVDERGIAVVIKEAVAECAASCAPRTGEVTVLLDGGLKAPKHFKQKTIIKGDVSQPVIAIASIVAKVARDAYMTAVAGGEKYGFAKHKGYGTREHRSRITAAGMHAEHRRSFLKRREMWKEKLPNAKAPGV
jgi:ribonuclease HII